MRPHLSIFNYAFNTQGDNAEIHIDGYIVDAPTQEVLKAQWNDETSVSYKSFRDELTKLNAKTIDIYINSGGGHVGDAMAIHDLLVDLQNKGITINTHGRGIVASAATYLLMVGNSSMSENSWFMIHNVSGIAIGDVNQVENQARTLRKFNDRIRDFYAGTTGLPAGTIAAMMNKETWLTATEAKEKGFIKNVTGEVSFKNTIAPEHWPYSNTAVLNAYNASSINHPSNTMVDKIVQGIVGALQKLNLVKKENTEAQSTSTEATASIEKNTLVEVLNAALQPFSEQWQTQVEQTVDNKLLDVDERIQNTINKYMSEQLPKQDAIQNLKTELDTLKKDVVNQIGSSAQAKTNNAYTTANSKYDHPGIEWGN